MASRKLDATLDELQNTRFANKYHSLIQKFSSESQFTKEEMSCILMVFHKFVLANGPGAKGMSRRQFFQLFFVLFKIYDKKIVDRIFLHVAADSQDEINENSWVKLISVYMTDNLEEKMRFAFDIYKSRSEGLINREVVVKAVANFFTGDDEDDVNEMRADMVDLLFQKFDKDKDGAISYEDYTSVVSAEPLLLEFLGRCFPASIDVTVTALCLNIMSKVELNSAC